MFFNESPSVAIETSDVFIEISHVTITASDFKLTYIHTCHSRFIPEGIEVSQIFFRETHVLPNYLAMRNTADLTNFNLQPTFNPSTSNSYLYSWLICVCSLITSPFIFIQVHVIISDFLSPIKQFTKSFGSTNKVSCNSYANKRSTIRKLRANVAQH
jgi:hypothetical protein